jgi:hypothetical protein
MLLSLRSRGDPLPEGELPPHRHSCRESGRLGSYLVVGVSETEPLSEAKQVLLRALDSITDVEQDMDAEVRHVAVIYSVYKEDEEGCIREEGGWNHSSDPAWLIGAMLRRGADAVEGSTERDEDDED